MKRLPVTLAVALIAAALPAATLADTVRAQNADKRAHTSHGRLHMISMDIDFKPHRRPEQGQLAGFDPVVTEVHVGDRIRFTNTDDVQHTATGYSFGGGSIPADYRFQGDPSQPHGDAIGASEWSTGNVRPHSVSAKVFRVTTPGTYYFADGYNQKKMRGAIVVKQ